VFAAELDHFMGRDMTAMAFAWPTHQDIFSYVSGTDVRRGQGSAEVLATLIELLATETPARRIHVLSWSAGGRVAAKAMALLCERYPSVDPEARRMRFRLGTAYFAAGDVPTREFMEEVTAIHSLVDQLVITQSSHDLALDVGKAVMGGGSRIGQEGATLDGELLELILTLDRLEIVDVSIGAETRGFDITGHRYWFHHPWASSDVLLSIRTTLGPAGRGLEHGDADVLWYLPADYPQRLRDPLRQSELRSWSDHAD
jgi:esterase/lipase superfamily enzyme